MTEQRITYDRYEEFVDAKNGFDAKFFAVEFLDSINYRISYGHQKEIDKILSSNNLWVLQETDEKKGCRISFINLDSESIIEIKNPLLKYKESIIIDDMRAINFFNPEINFYGFNKIAA